MEELDNTCPLCDGTGADLNDEDCPECDGLGVILEDEE